MFQCRTRQVVGCNQYKQQHSTRASLVSMPHAASGRLQQSRFNDSSQSFVVSMPHAASGRLQLPFDPQKAVNAFCFNAARGKWSVATKFSNFFGFWINKFQCRTRQVVGCNDICRNGEGTFKMRFQCRTRQVVGCNSTMSEAP